MILEENLPKERLAKFIQTQYKNTDNSKNISEFMSAPVYPTDSYTGVVITTEEINSLLFNNPDKLLDLPHPLTGFQMGDTLLFGENEMDKKGNPHVLLTVFRTSEKSSKKDMLYQGEFTISGKKIYSKGLRFSYELYTSTNKYDKEAERFFEDFVDLASLLKRDISELEMILKTSKNIPIAPLISTNFQ